MKKAIIPIIALFIIVFIFVMNHFKEVTTIDINGYVFTSDNITNNLTNGLEISNQKIDYKTIKTNDKLYKNHSKYYVGEKKKKEVNLEYPIISKDNSRLLILTENAEFIDNKYRKTKSYKNSMLANGELYNLTDYERADNILYYFLKLENGIFVSQQEITLEKKDIKYIIPINSFISFSDNSLRYYYLKNEKFIYNEIEGVDYKNNVLINNQIVSYENLLIQLEILSKKEEISVTEEPKTEENEEKEEIVEEIKPNEYIKPEVSLTSEKEGIYSISAKLNIKDPSATITRSPTFEIKMKDKIYLRKTFSSSGNIEIIGLYPETEYEIIGYYNYKNENGKEVKKTFYEKTIKTKDISNVEDLNLNIEDIITYPNYVTLSNFSLSNKKDDEVLKGLKKIILELDDKEYQLSNDLVKKLNRLESFDYDTAKSLISNTKYNATIKMYDVAGNELKVNNNQIEFKTAKEKPTINVTVEDTDITEVQLKIDIKNKDDIKINNLHYIVYDQNKNIIEEQNINNNKKIKVENLNTNSVYTIEVYGNYDLEDGKGIVKDYKFAETRFITEPLSILGFVKLELKEDEITKESAKFEMILNQESTNSRLIELVDSFKIEIINEENDELERELYITKDEALKLKTGDKYSLFIDNLDSKTQYRIKITTNIYLANQKYELTTLINQNEFKTHRKEATVNIINKFTTEKLIDFDVKVTDTDGAILSKRIILEVRDRADALVYMKVLNPNEEYERITLEKLDKEETYKFSYIVEEYNLAYNNLTFEENKLLYYEENTTTTGIYGTVELESLLKQITGKNIFDISNTRRWKSTGNDKDRKSQDLSKNIIYLAAKNGYRSYSYYLPEYKGKTLTVSFEAKYTSNENKKPVYLGNGDGNRSDYQLKNLSDTEYTKYTYTFTLSNAAYFSFIIKEESNKNNVTEIAVRNLQIEEGKTATTYQDYKEKKQYKATMITNLVDSKDEIATDNYFLRYYEEDKLVDTVEYDIKEKTYVENEISTHQIEPNKKYDVKLSVKIRDRFYDIANVLFTSEDEIRTIRTTSEYFATHTSGIYLVAADLDFRNINKTKESFAGTIDFQGHKVYRNVNNSSAYILTTLSPKGTLKNIDFHYYLDNKSAKSGYYGIINQTKGTIENIKVTLEECTSVANTNISLIANENTGLIKNFALYAKVALHAEMFASLGIRHNYGKMVNGYAYGEPINGTYINNSANPKRLAAISGYSGSNSTIENVYSLIGVNTISKDMGAVNNNQVGNILGAIDRTIIKNAYSYAEGSNRDISLDANIGSASYVNAKNVYYVSEQMYSGKYSNKVSKLALRNKEFQEKILNNEKAFNIDDFVTYGYYPQLIWPDVMPKQEYIELPKVEDADLIDVVSIASVTEKEDKAEIVINVSNPSGERISDIAIKDITAKILNQETKNGQTLLTIEVSNPVKYLSKYYIRSITSIGAYNISYTREYKDKERTLEFDMYRKIRTVNDFKNIKKSLTENYKLVNDLDFINVTGLQLGNFSGKFDGGNHTIKNIEITSGGNLFGTVTGTIQNLKVENYKKTNATTEGGLIALLSTSGYVDNVHVKNIELTGVNYVGGIAARSSNGTISNSSVTNFKLGDLTNAKTIRIGGIVGNAANTMIDNCYAQDVDMKIFGVDITYGIGGIVGRFETGYIRNVYAEGTIEADTQEIGGIAGYHAGYIDSAISLVNIYTTQDSVGGIVGYATNSNITKTLVFGDVYSSKKTINLNRTTGNYASSPVANFAWEGQKVNGIESQLSNGDRLLTTEELNSELVYTSTIQLSDDFDYSKSALSILPKLYNYKTRELLPNQKDIKFVKQDFKIREINVSKSISTAIVQIHIDNPENYEITNIKIDGLKIDEVKKNITTDGYTLYEISASPEKYYDSYVLKEIEYLDAGKKKIKKESARVDVIFYKDLESFEDWQKISTTDSENYRLVADIDFEGKVNIKTDVMFNRLEGTGEGHTLKNMTVNLNKERSGLIASVISNIENVNFENIIVNNTATGDYTGLIRTLNSNASNLYFKNIKINTPKLSSSGIIGYNQGPDVRDIVIEDVEVIGKGYLGGFIGRCRYFDMTNISIKNVNIQGDGTYVGGMVGYKEYLYSPTHFNMSAENVTVVNKTGTYTGGVYGYGGATRTTAKNINVTGTSYVGGISGHSGTGTLTHNTITDSEIYGSTNAIGGITGYVYHAQYFYADNIKVYGTKETCTNVGGISGIGYTGGYAINYSGVANSLIESLGKNVGGIKGYLQTSNVNQSYVINTTVQGSQNVGGIVGTATGTTCVIYNCMTNATVIATDKSSGGIIGYVQNLNTTSANNITKIYYCIVQGANVGANYYSGGLIGSVDKILYPNHIYNNIVVTNVQSTLLNKNDYGAVIGNGDFYASGIKNLKVYEHSTVNNELIKNVDTGLDKSTLITLDQLKTQSTYTNINMTTSVFDYSQLKNNKYPKLKNATSSIFLDLPTSATTTNLLKRTRSSDIHVMPDVNVYAVDVDKINVEFSKIDPQTIFTINGESKAVNQLTYTYKYDFKEDFDIILTDGINKKTITIKKDEIVNKTSVSDGNYYYLDDSTVITNDTINSSNELAYHNNKIKQVTSSETINNAVNIFNDKILLDDQNIYNIKTKTIVQNSFENLTEIDVLPLYTFRFNDETIQTYYNYSIINNETITKQVFVKDSKIEVIDSSLNNKKDQIFIENYNGKTYILYLGTDNKLYNLKDDIKYPDKFKNRNIKSITSNITNNSNLIFVLYEDGNYILFDYHTGNIVLENKENKESIFSYFKESIKEISNKKIKKDNEYKKAKQLLQKITEKPIDEVLNKDNSNEIIKNNNIVTSVYNPVTKKYILYEISDSNHGNSDSITNVFNNISISETIENNDTLYEYYNGTGEKQKKLILSATIIIGTILSLIIFATIFLFKNMKKNNSKI